MSEPTAEEVRDAVAYVRGLLASSGSPAWEVVMGRINHALEQVEEAYPLETHDWVTGAIGTYGWRYCAYCERIERLDGTLLQDSVRPCSFERRPLDDPARS